MRVKSERKKVDQNLANTYVQLCETGSVAKLCFALLQLPCKLPSKLEKESSQHGFKKISKTLNGILSQSLMFTGALL